MKHKSYLILMFLLMAVGGMAQQQQPNVRTPEQEAAKQTAMLQRTIMLEPEQLDTVYNIHLKYAVLRREVVEKEDRERLFKSMINELRGVLTNVQYERLNAMQMDSKRGHHNNLFIRRDSIADPTEQQVRKQ